MTTEEKCSWVEDSDGTYNSSCGEAFVFNEDGCTENGFRFCCYCGKPLFEVKYIEEVDEEDLWEHYCTAEGTKISVGVGESCNWCGLNQEGITT